MENTTHLDDELLERYALHKLRDEEAAPVEEHLFVCHACQDRLAAIDEFIHAFRGASAKLAVEPELAAKPEKQPWLPRFFQMPKLVWVPAVAAAAVLAIVIQTPPSYNRTEVVQLRSLRSAGQAPEVESGAILDLRLGTEGLRTGLPYRVEIANDKGATVWYGAVTWKNDVATVNVPKLLVRGQYWVRLYEAQPDSDVVREFSLVVR